MDVSRGEIVYRAPFEDGAVLCLWISHFCFRFLVGFGSVEQPKDAWCWSPNELWLHFGSCVRCSPRESERVSPLAAVRLPQPSPAKLGVV